MYRARDTKLGRDVALKILPQPRSPADAIAGRDSNAKHDCSPHSIIRTSGQSTRLEDASTVPALVLESSRGTRASSVRRGPSPLSEALAVAQQSPTRSAPPTGSASYHRGLQTLQHQITPDGVVKALDFGLAKALGPEAFGPEQSLCRNHDGGRDESAGLILGTART